MLLLFLALILCPIPAFSGETVENSPVEDVLAQVAGVKLTKDDLEQRLQSLPSHVQAMVRVDRRIRDQILQRWVRQMLMAREAESQGLDRLASMETRIREYRDQLLAEELLDRRLREVAVISEEECRAYFEAHPDFFKRGEEVKIAQILFAIPENAPEPEVDGARSKADQARSRLAQGEAFESIARSSSDDNVSKHRGGYLGFFGRGKLIKEFEEAAFATPVGEVSAPVRTAMGLHLIKVLEHQPDRLPAFDEVKDDVHARLQQEKRLAAEEKLLAELMAKYPVTVFPQK